tara:strand:+ start:4937 stop:7096 length:2160 start_codon:yes stop_codon:yes gene_type:complete
MDKINNKKDNNIYENYVDLINSINIGLIDEGKEPSEILLETYGELLVDQGNFEEKPTYTKYDDKRQGLDGFTTIDSDISKNNANDVHLFKVNYSADSSEITNLTSNKIDTAHNRVKRFFEKCFDDEFVENLPPSNQGREAAQEIREINKVKRTKTVHLHFITNERMSDRLKWKKEKGNSEKLENVSFQYHLWDLSWYNNVIESSTGVEDIAIELEPGIDCILASSKNSPLKSYLAVLSGDIVADWFEDYGDRLIEQNVRTYLQARGNVNKGISKTIEEEPGYFLPFNNGLTASCTNIELKEIKGSTKIASIENLQIVNGGQTSGSILRARKEGKDLSEVYVQLKISVVEPEAQDDIIPLISEYSNTQNKVSSADFVSNREYQRKIGRIADKVTVVGAATGKQGTKWFYERVRGQYNNQPHIGATPSQKKTWKRLNPANQKLNKTDLAKYYNTFECLPNEVSKGAQKNLMAFTDSFEKKCERNTDFINEEFFRDLIGKTILYRETDKDFLKSPWYNGFKIQIVNYSLSWLTELLKKEDRIINFNQIWLDQKTDEDLLKIINRIGRRMSKIIIEEQPGRPSGTGIPSEYAKANYAWENIKKIKIDGVSLLSLKPYTINLSEKNQKEEEAKEEEGAVDDVADSFRVAIIGEGWKELLILAKQEKLFSPQIQKAEKDLIKNRYAMCNEVNSSALMVLHNKLEKRKLIPKELTLSEINDKINKR